jgi:hypothetical protein
MMHPLDHVYQVGIVREDLVRRGLPLASLGALNAHQVECERRPAEWYNSAKNYTGATEKVMQCKLEACCQVMLQAGAGADLKATAADMLLDLDDETALATGVTFIVKHGLLGECKTQLDAMVGSPVLKRLSLTGLKGAGLTGPVPEELLRICSMAEFFDLSGNAFEMPVGSLVEGGGAFTGSLNGLANLAATTDDGTTHSFLRLLIEDYHKVRGRLEVIHKSRDHLADLEGIQYFEDVQVCHFEGCMQLNDISAIGGCTRLRSLNLKGCEKLVSIAPLSRCARLQTLSLYGCKQLTSITALAQCPDLRSVDSG